ncbi:MAG: GNAT family N-acetyltransferase [Herpetosiphonaceae bacterium]|nr:GNAT family N-acetyltransferase [Herpetosiphonaceae bacterium]
MGHSMPPGLPNHTWRPLAPGDAPAYQQLAQACAQADRVPAPQPAEHEEKFASDPEVFAHQTLGLFHDQGELRASVWITLDDSMQHEYRAFLDMQVAPALRGASPAPESFLLVWGEERTRQLCAGRAEFPFCVLRLDFYHQNQASLERYVAAGFAFALAEDEMRRDLSLPIATHVLPTGMIYRSWTAEVAPAFFSVYSQAFRERPGFPGWSAEMWCRNMTGHDEFCPDLSLLVSAGETDIGFAICAVENEQAEAGHIIQIGVVPAYRHQGVGNALLAEVMRRFKAADLRYATLEVNVNNPEALRVYQHNGFEQIKCHSSYRKTLSFELLPTWRP